MTGGVWPDGTCHAQECECDECCLSEDRAVAHIAEIKAAWEWGMEHLRYASPEGWHLAASEAFAHLDRTINDERNLGSTCEDCGDTGYVQITDAGPCGCGPPEPRRCGTCDMLHRPEDCPHRGRAK